MPFGSITSIDWVTYTNTFGERFLVQHPRAQRENDSWRMFSGDDCRRLAELDALVLPPAVVSIEEGAALEDVLFLRDENANLVWAVERSVAAPSGDTRSRIDEHTEPSPRAAGPVPTADLDYVLQTGVPDHWIPYLPRTSGYRALDLVQGRMLRFEGGAGEPPIPPDGLPVSPRGRLLNEPGSRVMQDARCRARVSACAVCPCSPDGWTASTTAGRRVGSASAKARERAVWASTSPAPASPPPDYFRLTAAKKAQRSGVTLVSADAAVASDPERVARRSRGTAGHCPRPSSSRTARGPAGPGRQGPRRSL